jgi:hypothetical protein
MNARSTEDALDRLAPREQFAHDWTDVLDRAGVHPSGAAGPAWQRRKWLLVAAIVAAVVVPVATATVAVTNWNGWWSSPGPVHSRAVTEAVVVQTGSWDGKRWQLVAYRESVSNLDGYCYSVMPFGSSATARPAGGHMCGGFISRPPDAPAGPAGINYGATKSPGLPYWAAGPVVDTATEVALYFRDGDVLRLPTYPVPESFGHVRFYANPIPEVAQSSGRAAVKVVGIDERGTVVACARLDPAAASC